MKTLNEVIEKMEKFFVCPCADEANEYCDLMEVQREALQYLKAYKDDKDDLTALRAFWAEQQANPPLTWDELRQMGGKPIWVEYSGYTPNWEIVENIGAVRGSTGDFTGNFIETNKGVLHKNKQGTTWQAYRKERE